MDSDSRQADFPSGELSVEPGRAGPNGSPVLSEERRARQAEILLHLVSQASGDPEGLVQRLAETLVRDLGVDRAAVLLLGEDHQGLVCLGEAGRPFSRPLRQPALPLAGDDPLLHVVETGQPFLASDPPESATASASQPGRRPLSTLAVPVATDGKRRGVLVLESERLDAFGPDDLALALVLAARIGVLVEESELRQRRLELERLRAEAKARQEFVSVVSHELKTPVAVIKAYTELLLRRAERSGEADNVEVLGRIAEQAERMLVMIDQILDLQRLEAGLMPLEMSRFDLVSLSKRVAEELGSTTSNHRIVVEASDPIVVVADRGRIEEVLQNLIGNAIKYSPGGEIAVTLRTDQQDDGNGRAIVEVRDQGVGIAPEEQPRVFERFYQGRNRLQEGHVGLGLGLHISRELIRRHGGEMWLESQPGVGSSFYFSVPVAGPAGEDEDEP